MFIFIRSLEDNESLSLKILSEKLVVLLVLTSADRGSELAAHDLRFRKFHPEGVEFNLPELTKSVRVGKISNPLFMRASLKTSCCVLVSASRCMSLSHPPLDL